MPSNFDWIFKRDPYAAERERASDYVNPQRGYGQFGLPRDAWGRAIVPARRPGRAASHSRAHGGPVTDAIEWLRG
jgi:hypothetical protein